MKILVQSEPPSCLGGPNTHTHTQVSPAKIWEPNSQQLGARAGVIIVVGFQAHFLALTRNSCLLHLHKGSRPRAPLLPTGGTPKWRLKGPENSPGRLQPSSAALGIQHLSSFQLAEERTPIRECARDASSFPGPVSSCGPQGPQTLCYGGPGSPGSGALLWGAPSPGVGWQSSGTADGEQGAWEERGWHVGAAAPMQQDTCSPVTGDTHERVPWKEWKQRHLGCGGRAVPEGLAISGCCSRDGRGERTS